jgi:hypothetical protein
MEFKSDYLKALKSEGADWWVDKEGLSWERPIDYVGHFFGICGCGRPEDALQYIGKALVAMRDASDPWDNEKRQMLFSMFHDDGAAYFFWYRMDNLDLTEHGGAVPGWLTAKGKDMIVAIEEALAFEETNPPA